MEVRISENNDYITLNNKHQIKIIGTFQEPYFCVEDASRVFGSSNIDKVKIRQLRLLKEFDKNRCSLGRTHFQNQPDNTFYMNIVGLFILAETEEHQDAVFEDIFPAIRKRMKEKLSIITIQLNDLMK